MQTFLSTAVFHFVAKQRKKSNRKLIFPHWFFKGGGIKTSTKMAWKFLSKSLCCKLFYQLLFFTLLQNSVKSQFLKLKFYSLTFLGDKIKTARNFVSFYLYKFASQTSYFTAVFHFVAKQRKESIPKTEVLLIDSL